MRRAPTQLRNQNNATPSTPATTPPQQPPEHPAQLPTHTAHTQHSHSSTSPISFWLELLIFMLPCHDAFSLFESGDPSFCAVVGKGALGLLVHHYTTYIMYAMWIARPGAHGPLVHVFMRCTVCFVILMLLFYILRKLFSVQS